MPNKGTMDMMKLTATIVVLGLLTVSLFGFAVMNHGAMGCGSAVAGMNDGDCPLSLISMALHHISAYTNFSEVTVASATILLLSIMAIAFIFKQYLFAGQKLAMSRLFIQNRENSSVTERQKISHWLSLFENSPSIY